jgi:hypothetical protein
MNDPHVARAIWVRHVAGVHSWGLTHETDNPPIEYGGLSGSQILLFLAVDAFAGIDRYHSEDQQKRHISRNLRHVAATIGRHSFRKLLSERSEDDIAIGKAFQRMAKQLRVSKSIAHRKSNA